MSFLDAPNLEHHPCGGKLMMVHTIVSDLDNLQKLHYNFGILSSYPPSFSGGSERGGGAIPLPEQSFLGEGSWTPYHYLGNSETPNPPVVLHKYVMPPPPQDSPGSATALFFIILITTITNVCLPTVLLE